MAYLTISEFSRVTGISVSALRFYDTAGVIVPAQVDGQSGYRRYSPEQAPEAERVRDLRRLEMPITSVKAFLAAPVEVRHKMLEDHLSGLTHKLRELEMLAARIGSSLEEEEREMSASMSVNAVDLAEAIDQVAPAAGTDLERPVLQVVLVEARDGSLRLAATDSYRLAVRDLVPAGGHSVAFRALVPAARLARARIDLPPSGVVGLSLEEGRLRVTGPAEDAELGLLLAEYPDYEGLLEPDPQAVAVIVEREPLVTLLRGLLEKDVVRLSLSSGRVSVDDREVAVGEPWTGPDLIVGLNPRFLHYAVGSAMGPDVRIEVASDLRPVLIRAATDGSFVCLVMPIKLD